MTYQEFKELKLPDAPGVYFFRGTFDAGAKTQTILYIGRATSLRDRVKSYFNDDLIHTRGPLLVDMVTKAATIEWQETDSVLEAIILEAHLIKEHLPYFNTKEKDNKSFNYVVITDEEFPRVLMVRGRNLENQQTTAAEGKSAYKALYTFGPFPYGGTLIAALKIIRKMFPYRDKCTPNSGKPCFNRQIGLCPGVCSGEITAKEYRKTIARIKLFFEGKRAKLIEDLEKDMHAAAADERFEEAAALRSTLYNITHIHDMSVIKEETNVVVGTEGTRIEAYDVAHLSGTNTAGVMVVAYDGEIDTNSYRKFRIKTVKGANEVASLKELLNRRFSHPEWPLPTVIAVDGNEVQKKTAEDIIAAHNLTIPVLAVVKDDRHKAREILGDPALVALHGKTILKLNAEAHRFSIAYHRLLRSRIVR